MLVCSYTPSATIASPTALGRDFAARRKARRTHATADAEQQQFRRKTRCCWTPRTKLTMEVHGEFAEWQITEYRYPPTGRYDERICLPPNRG
jgi:hypothetical protein